QDQGAQGELVGKGGRARGQVGVNRQRNGVVVGLGAGRDDTATGDGGAATGVGGHTGKRRAAADGTSEGGDASRVHGQTRATINGTGETDVATPRGGEGIVGPQGHGIVVALRSCGNNTAAVDGRGTPRIRGHTG